MKIKLKNISARSKVYILLHQHYCEPQSKCDCLRMKRSDALIPSSLSLLPGETSRALPAEVLEIPEIKRDVKDRNLQVRRLRSPSIQKTETTNKRRQRKSPGKNNEGRSS